MGFHHHLHEITNSKPNLKIWVFCLIFEENYHILKSKNWWWIAVSELTAVQRIAYMIWNHPHIYPIKMNFTYKKKNIPIKNLECHFMNNSKKRKILSIHLQNLLNSSTLDSRDNNKLKLLKLCATIFSLLNFTFVAKTFCWIQ